MTGECRVSVVIPAYNAAAFIDHTLDGVREQTFTACETIVVDDGSSDDTSEVVAAYFARYQMAGQVIRQVNGGIAAARNTGMRAARGTFVALLDHDDRWYPEKLATVLTAFEQSPGIDLICHDENITRDGRVLRVSRRRMPRGILYDALLFQGNLLSPSATTFRRDRALEIGGFDERAEYITVEDYEFWMRFSRHGRIRFIDRVLGEYVLVERAASRRVVYHHAALERMLRDHLKVYLASHTGLAARLSARRRLARVYRSAARQLIAHGESPAEQRMFVGRMLWTYPLELRNMAVALLWIAAALRAAYQPVGRSG